MSLSALRLWGALTLAALVGQPATMAGAATPTKHSTPRLHASSTAASKGTGTTLRHTRRRRHAPPGGVYARNAVVLDPSTDEVLFAKNADSVVPIASLSKLMTVMVFLEGRPDLDRWVAINRDDWYGAGRTHLRPGELVSLRDLLHMTLMCSDNCATRVLARQADVNPEAFVTRMNQKCAELDLEHTRFVEVTGLDERNVSTAGDCAHMLLAAARQPQIQEIMQTREYSFSTSRRSLTIPNTDRLLYGRYVVLGGKTGFISEAGYCFATWLHTDTRDLVAVVLGAPTAATRFADVTRMVDRTTSPSFAPTDQ
jgi:D-alanyl-D-alanine endopeptidase (penicillin-binding protein 7)